MTKDIAETLERKIGYRMKNRLIEEIKDMESEFLSGFWPYIPDGLNKLALDASPVSNQLQSVTSRSGYPTVSLDPVYIPDADDYLDVTRVTNPETGEVRIAERPGSRPLEEQATELKKYKDIVLADVGIFEGKTLLKVCDIIEAGGINIKEIYIGFANRGSDNKMNGRNIIYLYSFDFYEWIELRDFFGIDGRNVGMSGNEKLFIPYWENLPGWASIADESEQGVAELCRNYNKKLMESLKREGYNLDMIGEMTVYGGRK